MVSSVRINDVAERRCAMIAIEINVKKENTILREFHRSAQIFRRVSLGSYDNYDEILYMILLNVKTRSDIFILKSLCCDFFLFSIY